MTTSGLRTSSSSIDPVKELIGIFLAQYEPFGSDGLGEGYWSFVHRALMD